MDFITYENIITLLMLIVLQSVLGIDNLLYIALESKRAPLDKQSYVRKIGITIAVLLRIVLLFVLVQMIAYFQEVLFEFETLVISGKFNLHSLIVLVGGIFIIYTSTSEIIHMLTLEKVNQKNNNLKSVNSVIFSIVLMNLVFSFDSILAAIALTDSLVLMIIAILTGGLIMIKMANGVTEFLKKNRMFEVLGLFILFIVGIMLLTEGAHLAHMHVFENPILPMSKTTFYFTIFILIIIDIIQLRYQKILVRKK
jgi:predicted tellurium resistance membrane protein TerC|tara:strand:- start:4489 stop:5250 length:762 start_codon:yes stop_codon:yes gene_type:complete